MTKTGSHIIKTTVITCIAGLFNNILSECYVWTLRGKIYIQTNYFILQSTEQYDSLLNKYADGHSKLIRSMMN